MVSVRKSPKVGSPRLRAKRPATRTLVRWDDDKDKKLLLTVQYVCNRRKMKIPWDQVARTMGPAYSGGAIIQHLAKTRKMRVDEGLEVPPPLTKGGNLGPAETKEDKKVTSNKRMRTRRAIQDEDDDDGSDNVDQADGSDEYMGGTAKGKRKAKTQGNSRPRAVIPKRQISASVAGRKIHHLVAGSKAAASDETDVEDAERQTTKRESSSEGSPVPSHQHYGAGDAMWDLDSDDDTEVEIKRPHSTSPIGNLQNLRKVLVLNIGVAGFQKLGLAGGKGKFKAKGDDAQNKEAMSEIVSYQGIATCKASMLAAVSDHEVDNEMGINDDNDGAEDADEKPMTSPTVSNHAASHNQIAATYNDTGRTVQGKQLSDQFKADSMGAVNDMMHRNSNSDVDPFAYLAGASHVGNQATLGTGPVNAGQYGNINQTEPPGTQMLRELFPEMDLNTTGGAPFGGHTGYATEQYDWSSSNSNAGASHGYPFAQPGYDQGQQDNMFSGFGSTREYNSFDDALADTASHGFGHNTGFTDLLNDPDQLGLGLTFEELYYDQQDIAGDWNDMMNNGGDGPFP
ncbi:MAG: hypothetical protein Q9218_005951 [Villophora microphyllina]